MKRVISLACIVFFVCFLIAATPDSLKQSLNAATAAQKAEIMNQLAAVLLRTNPEEALQYALGAEKLADRYHQPSQGALALKLQGNYHYLKQQYGLAVERYQSALLAAKEANDSILTADLYNNLGQSYAKTKNYQLAVESLHKSLSIRQTLSAHEDEITSWNNLGQVYWDMQNYDKSAKMYAAAAELLEAATNPRLAATTYNNLGNAYSKNGNPVKALEAYILSLRIKESLGNQADLANTNANIGNLYYLTKEYANAIEYYEAAQAIYREIGDNGRLAQISGNLGVVYNTIKAYDKSLLQHQTALAEFRKKGMQVDIAKTLNNIGNVYKESGNYEQAISHYEQSLQIKGTLNDPEGLAITYSNMGEVNLAQGDFDSAKVNTLIALDAIKKINSQTMLRNAYQQLAAIYAAKKEYLNAYQALSNYVKLDHELYFSESRDVLAEMLVRFDTEEKSKEISQLKTERQLQSSKMAQQVRDKIRLIIILLFIALITLIMGILFYQKQREVKKRKAIQADLELLNTDLLCRVAEAVENDRKQQQIITQKSKLEALGRLSAGIAHEINQPLSALAMSLDNLQMTEERGKMATGYLGQKIDIMQDDIQRIRQIIEHVRLFSIDQRDKRIEQIEVNDTLMNSLHLLKNELTKKDIEITLRLAEETLHTIGNRYKLEQVLVNVISNARDAMESKQEMGMYYAEKMTLILQTTRQQDRIVIMVQDNGCGIPEDMIYQVFEPFHTTKNPDQGTGLGLSISYGIISEMQGDISIQSEVNICTKIFISLPILRSSNEPA